VLQNKMITKKVNFVTLFGENSIRI